MVAVEEVALHLSGQNLLICPGLLQLKHNPFFIHSPRFSVVTASTSIASGSRRWMFHHLFGSSLAFSEVFPDDRPRIHCILLKLLSSLLAQLYQSFRSLGGVGRRRRSLCKGTGKDLKK